VVAYEEMRMLREIFPDGALILHTTGQEYNGGPPLAVPDIFIPAIDTYATVTYRGEYVLHEDGPGWAYPKYVSSQYRKANCIGVQKGDRWLDVPQHTQDLINLHYNGRACRLDRMEVSQEYVQGYVPIIRTLEALWREKGSDPGFYERYYLPEVQRWTGDLGMPVADERR
jgi:hypothetical protein